MKDRFQIRQNENGGWELLDRKTGDVVASSAFYEFVDRARSRLLGWTSWPVEEARRYYRVDTRP